MGKLEGKRIAILVAQEFEDIELLYTLMRLSEEGAQIVVATLPPGGLHTRPWLADKPITGRFGSTVPLVVMAEGNRYTHQLISHVDAQEFDAVAFPGGFSPDFLRIDDATLDFTRDMHQAGKIVAAICHGPQVLISVDLRRGTDMVRGRKVTGYAAIHDDLVNAGGELHDVPAIRDGNIVTGRQPDDLPEFVGQVIQALAEG